MPWRVRDERRHPPVSRYADDERNADLRDLFRGGSFFTALRRAHPTFGANSSDIQIRFTNPINNFIYEN